MAADKEKIVNWCKANANMLFLGAMALLLVFRGALYMMDSAAGAPPMPKINAVAIVPAITLDSDNYKKVSHLVQKPKPFLESPYREAFVTNDMFDPKSFKTEEKIKQQANDFFTSARAGFDQAAATQKGGDAKAAQDQLQAAKDLVDKALERQPGHAGAQALRAQIEAKQAELAKAAAGGANPAPAPAAK